MSRRVYKLRSQPSGPGGAFRSHTIGVPEEIARVIQATGIEHFAVEMTEDGILYRPVTLEKPTPALPSWARPREG